MKSSRAYFKCIFRRNKKDSEKKRADVLANKLLGKCDNDFWKEIKKLNYTNNNLPDVVNKVSGRDKISEMWGEHYNKLLNSSKDNSSREFVVNSVSNISSDVKVKYSVSDIMESVNCLKTGKKGADNLNAEHLKFADDSLYVILTMLFNSMIVHNFIPSSMLDTVIVPLIKDKNGDVQDVDNYRPLALTCIISKLLEFVILLLNYRC